MLYSDLLMSSVVPLSYILINGLCASIKGGWAKVNMQRFEKQIKFRWGIVQLNLPIFNCKWQSVFPQSGIWQLIASLSSWASILSLMILLMGGLFALSAHYDKHIYPLTFRGLRTNGAIKSFNCALPHCLGAICTLLGRGGVVMERIPQSVTWVKAQGNFPASQPPSWRCETSLIPCAKYLLDIYYMVKTLKTKSSGILSTDSTLQEETITLWKKTIYTQNHLKWKNRIQAYVQCRYYVNTLHTYLIINWELSEWTKFSSLGLTAITLNKWLLDNI